MLIPLPLSRGSSRKRVDFLITGVQKAGTTALHAALSDHPDIRMAKKKEVHFFDKAPPLGLRAVDFRFYHNAFDWRGMRRETRVGEATPAYIWWPGALARIKAYNPEMQIIVVLRDPVERAWSQHWMDVSLGRKSEDFLESIETELAQDGKTPDRVHSMLSRGLYHDQLTALYALFEKENVLILRYEDLANDWAETYAAISGFLGIRSVTLPRLPQIHRTPNKPEIPQTIRDSLIPFFQEDCEAMRDLLGWDKGSWCV